MSISLPAISNAPAASAPALPAADFHKHGAHHGHAGGTQKATVADLLSTAAGTQPGELPVGAVGALLKAGAHLTEAAGRPVAAGSSSAAGAAGGVAGAGGGAAGAGGGAPRGALIDAKA